MQESRAGKVLLAIPSINGGALLARMLPSLRWDPRQVVVLDQGSEDETAQVCAEHGVELVQLGTPHTYTQAGNIGARLARERNIPYLCIANNDIAFRGDVLGAMLDEMERDPALGIVAPSQVIIDQARDRTWLSGRVYWNLSQVEFLHDTLPVWRGTERLEADFCELTCALVRMAAIEAVGFLDDAFGFYHEDADFGFRLRAAGYGCAYLPMVQIEHYASSTFSRESLARKRDYLGRNKALFARKHLGVGVNAPEWPEGGFARALHPYLRHYGLIDPGRPALAIGLPGAEPRGGYLLSPAEERRAPARWATLLGEYRAVFAVGAQAAAQLGAMAPVPCLPVPAGVETDAYSPYGPVRPSGAAHTFFAPVTAGVAPDAVLAAWTRLVPPPGARLILFGAGVRGLPGRAPDRLYATSHFEVAEFHAERIEAWEPTSMLSDEERGSLFRAADVLVPGPVPGAAPSLLELQVLACGVPGLQALVPPPAGGPTVESLLAGMQAALGLSEAERTALARAARYQVLGGATLRHTAMGLHAALLHLQARDPEPVLKRLEQRLREDAAFEDADPDRQPPAEGARRLSRIAAARVHRAGRIAADFGAVWYEKGFGVAGRGVAGELRYFARHRSRQVARLAGGITRRLHRPPAAARALAPPLRPGVLLLGYTDAQLGLGQSARGLARAMEAAGIPFAIQPIGLGVEGRRGEPFMPERIDETSAYAVNILEVTAEELPRVIEHVGPARLAGTTILRPYWELARVPDAWRGNLAAVDEIWAPSGFVANAFRTGFEGPITVVPPCVSVPDVPDADATAAARRHFGLDEGRFYFFFSFDYYSFPARKNPMGVVRAFRRAFAGDAARVGLIVKSAGAPEHFPEIKRALRQEAEQDGRIGIIDEQLSAADMQALAAAASCYVSLHRSEGFGLGMAEAMLLAKPVIATAYSGCAEFVREDTAFPVPYRLVPVAAGEYVHAEGQVWAEPDLDGAAAAMRRVVGDPAEARARARAGQAFATARFGADSVGRLVAERLRAIAGA